VYEVDPRLPLEHFHRQMHRRAVARRAVIELAGIGFCVGEEFWDGVGRQRRMQQEQHLLRGDQRNRREVLDRIVGRRGVERADRGERQIHRKQQRVAVGRRTRHVFGADVGRAADPVLDQNRLAERLAQRLGDEPRLHVVGAARREGHDQMDRLGRVCLRRRRRGERQYCGNDRSE